MAGPATAEEPEQIVNGTFDSGHAPWWGTGNITLDSSSGQLCADVPGGTANPWDVIIGQDNIAAGRRRDLPVQLHRERGARRSARR